jgi:23S rRNA (cytosine1962-C5)-methyltransferase
VTNPPARYPRLATAPGKHRRAAAGHPWIYANEVVLDAAAKALPPGTMVSVYDAGGQALGVASFNLHALVTLRLFDRDPGRRIDRGFLAERLARALIIRAKLFPEPYYRLIHAEADGLPGLVIDRYGAALVCQFNTAGMAALEEELLAALDAVLAPEIVVLRNDSPARALEGLESEIRVVRGTLNEPLVVRENACDFLADLSEGQKTGWFFDQRPNRSMVARIADGARLLDAYAFSGGFGIQAAVAGAADVTLLDRSEASLALAAAAARRNGVEGRVRTLRGEVFETLEALKGQGERYDVVVLDPPAFVKAKKDLAAGSRGYRKMVRLGAALVTPGGFLFAASCSHNMPVELFSEAVAQGLRDAGRTGRILHTGGAGPDHPVHPALPESAYLKCQLLALD